MNSSIYQNSIQCRIWPKDAHSLFDYESNEINKLNHILGKGGKLIKNSESFEIEYLPNPEDDSFFLTGGVQINKKAPSDALAFFYEENNNIYLNSNIEKEYTYNKTNLVQIQDKFWYVIEQKDLKGIKKEYTSNFPYYFKVNDIIRFGRVQFVVRYMNTKNKVESNSVFYLPNDNDNDKNYKSNATCSKCNSSQSSDDNPILKICQCEKSPYFHLNCFKAHIKNSDDFGFKEELFSNNNMTFTKVYNFICPLCDQPYNSIVLNKGKDYNLLPYTKPSEGIYLVLESLNFVKENIFTTLILTFRFPSTKEKFFLGRGHEATFKVSDISISRVHCKININEKGNIELTDQGSKFATMLLMRDDANIRDLIKKNIKVQVGNVLFWIEQK